MKIILYVLCCCIWFSLPVFGVYKFILGIGNPDPTTYLFTSQNTSKVEYLIKQSVDHFNPDDGRTFEQRFEMNDKFYAPGGPAFLLIGGAEAISSLWTHNGSWIEYAREMKAICFYLEHRYYGKSWPLKDLSSDNLEYLTSKQALADVANFISIVKKKRYLKAPKKWVVFGSSYAGSLAAWMRLKYPNLVNAAVSSSSPMVVKADFNEYFDSIENTLTLHSSVCAGNIRRAHNLMNNALDNERDAERLRKLFKFCYRFLSKNDKPQISNFFSFLAFSIAEVVQYNNINAYNDDPTQRIPSLKTLCDDMNNETIPDLIERYAKAIKVFIELTIKGTENGCIPTYNMVVYINSKISDWIDESANARQWRYQSCTEFGLFQTASKKSGLFSLPFPLKYFTNMCSDTFGKYFNAERLARAIEDTNNMYGGLNTSDNQTIFVYGSNDPWNTLGSSTKHKYSVFIEGTSHCADFYPSSDDDSSQLKEARQKIKTFLKELLDITL